MYNYELLREVVMMVPLFYIIIIILSFGQKYFRIYTKNKMLKFTQEEVKEKRKEVSAMMDEILIEHTKNMSRDDAYYAFTPIVQIFSIYNELAVGINEGLYDELYIKMVLGYEMIDFYKNYYEKIVSTLGAENISNRFMPLELLLKRWDSDNAPSYRLKNRRYL